MKGAIDAHGSRLLVRNNEHTVLLPPLLWYMRQIRMSRACRVGTLRRLQHAVFSAAAAVREDMLGHCNIAAAATCCVFSFR